jgi:cytochrome b
MRDEEILIGSLMENSWLTLEQVAAACTVEPGWLLRHIEEGLFPHAESVAGVWCFSSQQPAARAAHAATGTRFRCRSGTGGADGGSARRTGRAARPPARFSDFVRGPRVSFRYLKDALTLRAARYLGHNPAGGAMIVALLLSLTVTIVTGLALYGADKGLGPLAAWLAESSDATIDAIKEAHEVATNGTLLLVAGHLLGVIWESLLHGENLVRAMITGRKRALKSLLAAITCRRQDNRRPSRDAPW